MCMYFVCILFLHETSEDSNLSYVARFWTDFNLMTLMPSHYMSNKYNIFMCSYSINSISIRYSLQNIALCFTSRICSIHV
jgi:hypothetical protein